MPTQKDPTIFGYQNFFSTTLTGDITSGTLTIGLATIPSPTSGILVIEPDSTSSREVILYTSKGASTITCPADGRGWAGSSASAHLTGSTVIMAPVDEWFKGLADGTLSTDPLRTAGFSNFISSGGVVAQSSGLIGTFSNVVFWLNGQRYAGTSIANKTYTASKDTYVDITATSGGAVSVTYSEVSNGAASPTLAANYIRVAKVVTNGSAITGVTQSGNDSLNNPIYPAAGVNSDKLTHFTAYGNATSYPTITTSVTSNKDVVLPARSTPHQYLCIWMCEINNGGGGAAEYYGVIQKNGADVSRCYWNAVASDYIHTITLSFVVVSGSADTIRFGAGRTAGSAGAVTSRAQYVIVDLGTA